MRILAAVLAPEGWALADRYAACGDGVGGGGGEYVPAVSVDDGIPWSGVSGRKRGRPGVAVQIDLANAAGVLGNRDLMRIVRAAAAGRSVRTGRRRAA